MLIILIVLISPADLIVFIRPIITLIRPITKLIRPTRLIITLIQLAESAIFINPG